MNKQKDYWDKRFQEGEIWGSEPCPSAKICLPLLKESGVKTIYVPGCGYGRNSLFFAMEGLEVFASDLSDLAIERAISQAEARNCHQVTYKQSNLFQADEEEKYDAIYLSNVIHLFLAPERKALVEILSKQLRPNGLFIFTCISTTDEKNFGQGVEVEQNTFIYDEKILHFSTSEDINVMLEENFIVQEQYLHHQIESDPNGSEDELQLWYTVCQKRLEGRK